MASKLDIWNRALKKLGVKALSSPGQDSPSARACALSYPLAVRMELRTHPWNFAIRRASLAASDDQTVHGDRNVFPLPADWIRNLPLDPELNRNDLDHQIEGRSIVTMDDAPLPLRYIAYVEDTNQYDALFVDAVAARMALDMCEELTNSNTKKAALKDDYKDVIGTAKLTNAIENRPVKPPEDSFVTVRA